YTGTTKIPPRPACSSASRSSAPTARAVSGASRSAGSSARSHSGERATGHDSAAIRSAMPRAMSSPRGHTILVAGRFDAPPTETRSVHAPGEALVAARVPVVAASPARASSSLLEGEATAPTAPGATSVYVRFHGRGFTV